MDTETIKGQVTEYILAEFLPGEGADALDADVGLITDGIIDSMGSLRLVAFLEEKFGVSIPAHKIDAEFLDSVDSITSLVAELS